MPRDEAERKAIDFKELFASEQGLRVLSDLEKYIKPNESANYLDATGKIDSYMMMKNEGKRAVWCHINALINKDLSKKRKTEATR